jgi:hypothetical protein
MTRFALLSTAFALAFVFLLPLSAGAEGRHPELDRFAAKGGRVESLGAAYGLDGFVLLDRDGNNPRFVYTTPQGGLVIGTLVAPDGSIETQKQLLA